MKEAFLFSFSVSISDIEDGRYDMSNLSYTVQMHVRYVDAAFADSSLERF